MISRYSFDTGHTRFNNQSAMAGYLIASSSQQLTRWNSLVTEKAMNTMRILVAGTVVMKGECAVQVTSQKK